jgi:hypothetical protein
MKIRLLSAAAVLAALAGAVMPAHAEPYAGQFRYLSAGPITVQGADGARWLLAVFATQSGPVESRPEQRLYLDLSRCVGSTCTAVGRWSRPLTAAEVAIEWQEPMGLQGTSARLRTVLGGRNLDVTLTSGNIGGGAFDGLGVSTAPPGVGPEFAQYTAAAGSAKLGALTCKVAQSDGAIGQVETVDTVGDDTRDPRTAPPATLPAGFLTGRHAARC